MPSKGVESARLASFGVAYFLAAGAFVTFWMFSPHELIERAMKTPEAVRAINYTPSIGTFLTMVLLSFCAIMLLPRQFHVRVVENSSDTEVGRARWLFPLYLSPSTCS